MSQNFVVGFLYSDDNVLLVKKNRPSWQRGFWNGPGGKIESNESSLDAIIREYREETGLVVCRWDCFARLICPSFIVWYFRSFGDIKGYQSITDEAIAPFNMNNLPANFISPSNWLAQAGYDRWLRNDIPITIYYLSDKSRKED